MASSLRNYTSTQTAAGTTQATAAALIADAVMIVSLDAGAGVILPAANFNDERLVANGDTDAELFVYPPSGGKINNFTQDRAVAVAPGRAARFVCVNNLNWIGLF